mgnify:CR=1 FL=1
MIYCCGNCSLRTDIISQIFNGTAGSVLIFLVSTIQFYIYPHISPYFSQERRTKQAHQDEKLYDRHPMKLMPPWREYLRVHIPARVLASILLTQFTFSVPEEQFQENVARVWDPLLFFAFKLIYLRVSSDIGFYLVHYLLHVRPFYNLIHKTHHEHHYTDLDTNYHFSPTDLVLEGFVPFFFAIHLATLLHRWTDILALSLNPTDIRLGFMYLNWYQVGSHTGKPLPTVTTLPPFSFIYLYFFPNVDSDHILFHESHHNYVFCNYGITTWLDKLLGTCRLNHSATEGYPELETRCRPTTS